MERRHHNFGHYQGHKRFGHGVGGSSDDPDLPWILAEGEWNDDGYWLDDHYWKDDA